MTRWSVFTKLSLALGVLLFVCIYLSNRLISQEYHQYIQILSANSATEFPQYKIKFISAIFLTLGLVGPTIIIKILTAKIAERARLVSATLGKIESTEVVRNPGTKPSYFDLADQTLKLLHENILNSERLIQQNNKATIQSTLLTTSARDLARAFEDKLKKIIEMISETKQSESMPQQNLTFQLRELMNIASQIQEKNNETLKTLASLKSSSDEQLELIRQQFEKLGTAKSNQKKSNRADINLTSIIETLNSEYQTTNPFLKYINAEILGSTPESNQITIAKKSSVTIGNERPVSTKKNTRLTSQKSPASASSIQKTVSQNPPNDSKKILEKTRETVKTALNTHRTPALKSTHREPTQEMLELKVEEKKIPVRTDARFEDL
jgi:hypothetical protein